LASGFKTIGERLEKLEEELREYGGDISYLPRYTNISPEEYNNIKSGKLPPSNEQINALENFFGKKIISRWEFCPFEKLLYSICKRIYEGWKENERIEQFIEEKNIKIPERFKAEIIPPRDLLKDASLTCDEIVAALIEPLSIHEIRAMLGYKSESIANILSILTSYGITERIRGKYVLSSLYPFEIAFEKLSKRAEVFRAYVEALKLYKEEHLSIFNISKKLNVPASKIVSWISRKQKPVSISKHAAILLMKRGVISSDELELFERYELIS
jgi:DNA-binding transcriptional regulator YiaG